MMTLKHGLSFRGSLRTVVARRTAAGVVALHGAAHLVGTQEAVEAALGDTTVDYLAGALELSGSSLWVAGALWGLLAVAFIGVAVLIWTDLTPWGAALVVCAVASVAACVLALWAAWLGLIVNVALIGFVLAGEHLG